MTSPLSFRLDRNREPFVSYSPANQQKEDTMRKSPILLLMLFCISMSETYYVSTSGDNSNDGSFQQPWATPGYGSKQMAPGDSLVILSGEYVMETYYDDMITPPSGYSGNPTVVTGQGSPLPEMQGTGSLFSCVQLEDYSSNIIVSNMVLTSLIDEPYTGGTRGGIICSGNSSDILFTGLEIHRTEMMGIDLGGDAAGVTIQDCTIHHTAYTCIGGPSASSQGWVDVLIDQCYLGYAGHFYNGEDTLSVWDRPDGVGFEDSEGPVTISNTLVEHTNGDGLDSKAKRTWIHHCTVSNCFADGIKLWGDSSFVENTLVYGTGDSVAVSSPWCALVIGTDDQNAVFGVTNCTFWDSPQRPSHYLSTVQYDNPSVSIDLVLQNNLFCGNRRLYCRPCADVTAQGNLFRVVDESVQITANGQDFDSLSIGNLGTGNVYADPEFLYVPDWGHDGDFHVGQNSPAVDGGVNSGLDDDLDYFPRPYNSLYDIGCYEWHPTGISVNTEPASSHGGNTVRVSPNPALETATLEAVGPDTFSRAEVYSLDGRLVALLEPAGDDEAKFIWELENCRSGVYFARLSGEGNTVVSGTILVLE